jgi:hypothetical protein
MLKENAMKILNIDHMHGWTYDLAEVTRVCRDVLGLTSEERDFTPMQYPLTSNIVRVGDDLRFIEFFQPHNAEVMADLPEPHNPGLFAVNLRVVDVKKAAEELGARGIGAFGLVEIFETKQCWVDVSKTFGLQIELSEYPGDNLAVALEGFLYPVPKIPPTVDLGIERVDHLYGWAEDVDAIALFFTDTFGMSCEIRRLPERGIRTVAIRIEGDPLYVELIKPTSADALKEIPTERRPGLFGVGYKVKDLVTATSALEARGVKKIYGSESESALHAWFDPAVLGGFQAVLSEYH